MSDLSQGQSVLPQVSGEIRDLRGEGREVASVESDDLALRRDNVVRAVALGLLVGQAAIADVLTGGRLGVLGPKPTER